MRGTRRGAAIRAGADTRDLESLKRTALRRAGSVDCRSADVTVPAARVRAAFAGYQRVLRMNYPGSVSMWSADRGLVAAPCQHGDRIVGMPDGDGQRLRPHIGLDG